jgi:hypothetical protein
MTKSKLNISLIILAILISWSIQGQIRGTTTSISGNLGFKEKFTDVTLDPSPLTGSSSRVSFTHRFSNSMSPNIGSSVAANILKNTAGVDVPGWVFDLSSWFCSGITPSFSANATVEAGAYYQIHSVGKSDIEINYPVKITFVYPEENTFGCGDLIRIETSLEVLEPENGNKLKVKPPFFNQEIGPRLSNLRIGTTIGLDAWVGIGVFGLCEELYSWETSRNWTLSPPLPTLPPLVNICESAFGPNANEASLLSCNWSKFNPLLQLAQASLNAYNNSVPGHYSFASFPNENTVVIATPDLPEGGPTIPEMEGEFRTHVNSNLNFQSIDEGRKLRVSKSGLFSSTMNIDLVSFLGYAGITTSLSLGGGLGNVDAGDVAPTFTARQNMNYEYSPIVHLTLNLGREMNYSVFNANGTFSHSSYGSMIELTVGQFFDLQFPQDCSDPVNAWGESVLSGDFSTDVRQDYYKSLQVRIGKIDIPGVKFTLINQTIGNQKFDDDIIMNHAFSLELQDALELPSFILDPENPVVSINYFNVEESRYLGAGQQAIVYKLGIANEGDVRLNDLRLDFNLGEIYSTASYSVECTYSGDFSINPNFDGGSDINLLATGNSLEVGASGYVEVLVKVRPQIAGVSISGCFLPVEYNAMAKAYGVSPIGTHVENNFYHCTGERTGPDIIAAVDLGASIIEGISDFAIYGFDQVKLDKSLKMSMGNVGSTGNIVFENSSLHTNDNSVIIGDIHAGRELFLQGQSKVEANYVSTGTRLKIPNWKSQLILHGAISENSACVPVQPIININYIKSKSRDKIVLRKGETTNLPPGDYELVSLAEGSRLNLTSGEYNIDRWMFLGDNATVAYRIENAPVQLNLGVWQALNRRNLKLIVDGPGSAENVIYNYGGKQKCSFNASFIQGVIYAPEAEIEFTDGSRLEGSCYASTVNFKTGSSFKGLQYLKPLKINTECQNVLVPGQTSVLKAGLAGRNHQPEVEINPNGNEINRLKVYPNPTTSSVTITGLPDQEPVLIQIFNSTGRLIKQLINTAPEMQIDLQDQPSGLYYLKIEGFGSVTVVKM